jgi:hypothetical protein
MPDNRLSFRSVTPEDTPKIVPLLNQGFRTPIDAATWEWYVYGNPLGHSRGYLALAPDGEAVGIIAFAPIALRIGGVSYVGDFAHHLVLTPAYRDTLSFIAFNRHALKTQAALGREVTIGPPNRTAYPIHKTIMKWVDFGYLESLRKMKPAARPHDCRECHEFPPSFDRLLSDVSRDLAFCVEKNHAWLTWRFLRRPRNPYTVYTIGGREQPAGYVVMKRWQDADGYRKAHVIDIHALDDGSLAQLVAAAETYAADCDEVNLWAVKGYRYRPSLEALGFAANPAAHQPLIARPYDGSVLLYPEGPSSFAYGDGDTLY